MNKDHFRYPNKFNFQVARFLLVKLIKILDDKSREYRTGARNHGRLLRALQDFCNREEAVFDKTTGQELPRRGYEIGFGHVIGLTHPDNVKGNAYQLINEYFPRNMGTFTVGDRNRLDYFTKPFSSNEVPRPVQLDQIIADMRKDIGKKIRFVFKPITGGYMIDITNYQFLDPTQPYVTYHLTVHKNLDFFTDDRQNTFHLTYRDQTQNINYHEYRSWDDYTIKKITGDLPEKDREDTSTSSNVVPSTSSSSSNVVPSTTTTTTNLVFSNPKEGETLKQYTDRVYDENKARDSTIKPNSITTIRKHGVDLGLKGGKRHRMKTRRNKRTKTT